MGAVGVEYMKGGVLRTAGIAKGGTAAARHGRRGSAVVVTAGALHTPKVNQLKPKVWDGRARSSYFLLRQLNEGIDLFLP